MTVWQEPDLLPRNVPVYIKQKPRYSQIHVLKCNEGLILTLISMLMMKHRDAKF